MRPPRLTVAALVLSLALGVGAASVCAPSVASAWSGRLTSESGTLRYVQIDRGSGDGTGTVYVYAGALNGSALAGGSWDDTATGWSSATLVSQVAFDSDDVAAQVYFTNASTMFLLCFPTGQEELLGSQPFLPVRVAQFDSNATVRVRSSLVSTESVPVHYVTTPTVSAAGTVSVAGTVPVSSSATMSVSGTLPVDPWSTSGLPTDGIATLVSLVAAMGGAWFARAVG